MTSTGQSPIAAAVGPRLAPDSAGAAQPLDFYFDFVSPFGWIGAERIGALASRFGRTVVWRPFLLKVSVMSAMGLPPPLKTPLKGAYLMHDIRRTLRFHRLPLAAGARFGFSSVPAARAVLWARAVEPMIVEHLVLGLYRAHWTQARDISAIETVLDVAASLGLPRGDIADALADDALKAALREETERAIGAGVFGSPTFAVDGELFWGADRLSMVETWLETGGW